MNIHQKGPEQNDNQGQQPDQEEMLNRRGFIKSAAFRVGELAGTAAAVVTVRELANEYFRRQHESTFGSLREPEFLITERNLFGDVWTLNQHLKDINQILEDMIDRNPQAEARLDQRMTNAFSVTTPRLFTGPIEEEHGKAIDTITSMFKTLTGKDLPNKVSIRVGEIEEPNVAGLSNFLTGEVIVEDAAYWDLLSVMGHEIGHLTNQHQEAAHYASWLEKRPPYNEAQNLEEACAYLFQIAATWAIEDPYVHNLGTASMNSYIQHFASEFFSGEQEYHRLAVVLADSAIAEYGNPADAYNVMATTPKTPTAVWNRLDETRRLYERHFELRDELMRQ